MPLLEFRCARCETNTEVLVLAGDDAAAARCPSCGSTDMRRLVSKTFHLKSEADRLASLDTSRIMGGLDGSDVGSFERWARRTGADLDSALGSNFRELADKAAAGEDPVQRIDPGHTLRYHVEKKLSEAKGGDSGEGA